MPGPGPSGKVTAIWDMALAGPIAQTTTPLVFEGAVYVAVHGTVAMLDERTGAVLPTIAAPNAAGAGSLAIADGLLMDGTDGGLVAAWHLQGLGAAWTWQSTSNAELSLAATDDVLVATSLDGHAYVLDPVTGRLRWTLDAGVPSGVALPWTAGPVCSPQTTAWSPPSTFSPA